MNRDAALDRPLVMPELFHGKPSDDFEAWLQNFDISAAVNRWDDETRRQILLVRLRGPAQRLVLGLPEAALDDYAALRAALQARFLPPERVSLHRTELRTRRRQRGEPLSSLADDILLLAARAYPDADVNGQALVQQIALDAFVDALDDSLRRRVREREPANVQEALRRALTLECMDQSEQSRHPSFPSSSLPPTFPQSAVDPPSQVLAASVPPPHSVDRFGAMLARFEEAMDRMVAIVDRLSNVQPPVPPPRQAPRQFRRPVCYACGTPGHVRTECPHLHLPPSTSSSTPSQSSSLN